MRLETHINLYIYIYIYICSVYVLFAIRSRVRSFVVRDVRSFSFAMSSSSYGPAHAGSARTRGRSVGHGSQPPKFSAFDFVKCNPHVFRCMRADGKDLIFSYDAVMQYGPGWDHPKMKEAAVYDVIEGCSETSPFLHASKTMKGARDYYTRSKLKARGKLSANRVILQWDTAEMFRAGQLTNDNFMDISSEMAWHRFLRVDGFSEISEYVNDNIAKAFHLSTRRTPFILFFQYGAMPYHTRPYHIAPDHTIPNHTRAGHTRPDQTILYVWCGMVWSAIVWCGVGWYGAA